MAASAAEAAAVATPGLAAPGGGGSVADARQVLKLWLATNGEGQQEAAAGAAAGAAACQQPRPTAAEAGELELCVTAAGKLGLSLGPVDTAAGSQLLQVVGVAAGGAAELAAAAAGGAKRLRAGLVVAGVMGRPVAGVAPSGVMGMIKAAGRPLRLSLKPHPDEAAAASSEAAGPSDSVEREKPLVILSDLPLVHAHLRHPRFRVLPLREWDGTVAQLVTEQVDVLFVGRHVADFQALPSTVLVNQFVGESCVTSKLLIQEMLLRNTLGGARPPWLPEQYVVPDQRVALLGAWDRRQADAAAGEEQTAGGMRNSWIVRSGWGARSEGVWVTNSRQRLVELAEKAAADKRKWVVSRYIGAPALVDSRKFDLRFYVAVRRAGSADKSPQIFIHREFYCRRAIDPWGTQDAAQATAFLDAGEEAEPEPDGEVFPATEHLTVHCYAEDLAARAGQIFYSAAEFRSHWAADHAGKGGEVGEGDGEGVGVFELELASIRRAIAELFSCAASEMGDPELWPSSRGLYGIDVMLEHKKHAPANVSAGEGQQQQGEGEGEGEGEGCVGVYCPVILEANYSPDATRILQYHPKFYDEIFDCLFLEGEDEGEGKDKGKDEKGEEKEAADSMLLPLGAFL
jgi:hypothetical protein